MSSSSRKDEGHNNSEPSKDPEQAGPSTSLGVTPSSGSAASAVISEEALLAAIIAAEGDESITIQDLLQQQEGGFMVEPAAWCPHLEDGVNRLPFPVNVEDPCFACGSTEENWLCLSCFKVGCGRFIKKHLLAHGLEEKHYLALSFSDFSVWCYECQIYVHNEAFSESKQSAYSSKFGEKIPEI